MALALTQRMRIQTALIDALLTGMYYEVKYDSDQKPVPIEMDPNDPNHAVTVPPSSVRCNEIESQFGIDPKYGRGLLLNRKSWVFEVIAEWQNVEVTLEYLEAMLCIVPIVLPQTVDYQQVTLMLLNTIPTHPVQQQPSSGTQAKFTFRAVVGRD